MSTTLTRHTPAVTDNVYITMLFITSMNRRFTRITHTFIVEPPDVHRSVSEVASHCETRSGFWRLSAESSGDRGYWNDSSLCRAQETVTLDRADLLSTNQHIPLNVNEKRRLSSHTAPSPCLTYQPRSAVALTLPLSIMSLLHHQLSSCSQPPNKPLTWSVVIYSAVPLMCGQ